MATSIHFFEILNILEGGGGYMIACKHTRMWLIEITDIIFLPYDVITVCAVS